MLHRLPNGTSVDLTTVSSVNPKEDAGICVVIYVGHESKYLTRINFEGWSDAVAFADDLTVRVNKALAVILTKWDEN